ncbi:MAG: hypothetical protein R3Y11_08310 [Pseudomonadota bacterium]
MSKVLDIVDGCDTKSLLVPVDDDAFATAYDAVDASLRAHLKTNIALHHSMMGMAPSWQSKHTERATAGFTMTEHCRPISWVTIVLAENFASGPRLVAALMPALLAGITDVQLVRLVDYEGGESPWPHVLLAALELAGQEQVASACVQDVVAHVQAHAQAHVQDHVQTKPTQGRIIFLGENATLKSQLSHAVARMPNVKFWAEGHAPRLYIDAAANFDMDLIRWAHPDGVVCNEFTEGLSAVYSDGPASPQVSSKHALTLKKGCEALWVYTDLRREFFMQDAVSIGIFSHSEIDSE